jgi:hypothetical protein
MSKIYQVKISLKHENTKFKNQTITGVVLANEQSIAVATAMNNTQELIDKQKLPFTPKLVSAFPLPNDFIYTEPVNPITEAIAESKTEKNG